MMAFIKGILVFIVGIVWAIRRRERGWCDVSSMMLLVAILVVVEGAIGIWIMLAHGVAISAAHRWLAHALVLLAWCSTVITTAAAILSIRWRPVTAMASGACVALILSLVILESLTGYLGRDARGAAGEETRIRFYVLHCLVLPCVAIAAAIAGGLILRRANRASAIQDAGRGPIRRIESDNPYAAPTGD